MAKKQYFIAPGKSVTCRKSVLEAGTAITEKHGFSDERCAELAEKGYFTTAEPKKAAAVVVAEEVKAESKKPAADDADADKAQAPATKAGAQRTAQ
jgi:hypothetical protein